MICKELFQKLIESNFSEEETAIKKTLDFLTICAKYKIKVIGIQRTQHPELEHFREHDNLIYSNIYSNKQYNSLKWPSIWDACKEYIRIYSIPSKAGCGNGCSFQVFEQFYQAIYILDTKTNTYSIYHQN